MKNLPLIFCLTLLSFGGCKKSEDPKTNPNYENYLWGLGYGGANDHGAIFRMKRNGSHFEIKHSFIDAPGRPAGNLINGGNGKLYGYTGSLSSQFIFEYDYSTDVYAEVANASSPVLSAGAFNGNMVLAPNGKIYGTTAGGGVLGKGTVYSFDIHTHTLEKVMEFNGTTNGEGPLTGLFAGSDNRLYGTTQIGGTYNGGVAYCINPVNNTYAIFYEFPSGSKPYSLTRASNDKLYGITQEGGVNSVGSIFSIDLATGNFTTVHDFSSVSGKLPYGGLIEKQGILYGITNRGGANDKGVMFKLNILTSYYTKLFDFDGVNSGGYGISTLLLGTDGKLYGSTPSGGAVNRGVAFCFDPTASVFSKLHDFGTTADNAYNTQYSFIEF